MYPKSDLFILVYKNRLTYQS